MRCAFTAWRGRAGVVLAPLLIGPGPAQAADFCMLAAQTYYEQLYCEVTAGGGGALPRFTDFRRNSPTVQALLLKRPAQRLGIEVAVPRQKSPARGAVAAAAGSRPLPEPAAQMTAVAAGMAACRLEDGAIVCGQARYALVSNRANGQLAPGALGDGNRMELPAFSGDPTDAASINRYLYRTYQRYVEKMLAIGLGGSTMNYGKFAYLFRDLSDKGVDFARRFETMYRFLKKDKAGMGGGGRISVDQHLTLADCGGLGERLIVCARAGRNYVYAAGE